MKTPDKTDQPEYQVLARRFRPQQFDEILGQQALVTTLANSIRLGRVGHAYLFCGPRGVGKTTAARIFAKALNCAKGPAEKPCDKCQNCLEIIQGNALDVLEIDGASNRGIDEIRGLRENVKYMAASSRYKIYIIDEVHMLTQEAFNALLKTLEEPPAHVKFFFATTDPQKLPATILSRCQKFELRRIPAALMVERLNALAKGEKVRLTQDAALAVVRQAQGSMRDAESLLEVLIGTGQREIAFACVREILGLSDDEVFFAAVQSVFQGDAQRVLQMVADIFSGGKEPSRFLSGFGAHLRNLLLAKILGAKADALEMPAEQIAKLQAQAQNLSEEQLVALLDLATRAEYDMRGAGNTRILLELFFLKAVEYAKRPPLAGLLARLEKLESRLKGGASQAQAAPPPPQQFTLYDDLAPGSDINTTWNHIAQSLASTHPVVRACMQDASPIVLEDGRVLVRIKKGALFQKSTLEDKGFQDLIEQKLTERLGRSVKITVGFFSDPQGGNGETKIQASAQPSIENDPALRDALSILKGKIIKTTKAGEAN